MIADLVEQVRQQLAAERRRLIDVGLCACGCGELLPPSPPRRADRIYENERHRDQAYRDRLRRLAEASGVPLRASAQTLHMGQSSSTRRTDGYSAASVRQGPMPRAPRKPRPGVSVYFASPELAGRVLDALDGDELEPAAAAVRQALERRAQRWTR